MPESNPKSKTPNPKSNSFAVIGAGAVGAALARRLVQQGYAVEAVISRNAATARRLAKEVGAAVASGVVDDLPASVQAVCCCVPDDALEAVAGDLARLPRTWTGCTLLHTSGVRTAAVFAVLGERGAATLSFHPVQAFTRQSPPDAFDGIYIGLEGTAKGVAFGTRLATGMGGHAVEITAQEKPRYHLAAVLASNGLVTLIAMAGELLAGAGLDRMQGVALLQPLVEGTLRNLQGRLPEDVLTGPVARGDAATLTAHLEALGATMPHLVPVYVALSNETVRVAVRGGRLTEAEAQQLLDILHAALRVDGAPLF